MRRPLSLGAALLFLSTMPGDVLAQLYPVSIGQNFEGTTAGITSLAADTMGAAGIEHFVELNNKEFRVYDKSNGSVVQSKSINQFWVDANTSPLSIPFDPRVVYDPHARRWYAVAVDDRVAANNFLFAVSSSSDPTQPWNGFAIDSDADNSNWADFPMLAYNGEGVFISTNMPQLTAPQTRTAFVVLPKSDLLQPLPSIANMTKFEDVSGATTGFTPQLAIDDSNAFGTDMVALSMFSTAGGIIQRTNITPPGAPALLNAGQVIVAGAAQPPTVVQPGAPGVQNLESNDSRFSGNTVLRGNVLYAVQSIADMGLAAVRFLRIDVTNNAVLESLIIVDPASRALTFPSIAVNAVGDIVIGVTGTSTTEFASSYAIVGKTVGGVTSFDQPRLLRAGVDNYQRLDSLNRNRWGDYSATTVDPADPGIFWTNQEFVKNMNQWATQVTELIVPLPNEARWADPIDGDFDDAALWQTQHGGAPLPSEDVVFSRPATAGGSYIVTFPPAPPGTYMSQTASVRQGNVILDLNGGDWLLALHLEVGPFQGNSQATITNGTLLSFAGFIAPSPTSEGHLTLSSAQWDNGGMVIGSPPAPGAGGILPGAGGGVGSLTIDNNSQLNVGGLLTIWEQGSIHLVDGLLSADTIRHVPPAGSIHGLQFTGGTLHVNRFDGDLLNQGNGALDPGGIGAVGTTDVTGGYDQGPTGVLAIDITGAGPGQYDQLTVATTAILGKLDISFLGGYTPSLSDTFEIVTAGLIAPAGVANLVASTVFPSTGTNWLDWHVFLGPNLAGIDAITLAIVPTLTGDFNADGTVDAADYVIWRKYQNQSGFGLAADSNFDGVVDLFDYFAWLGNFGQSIPGPGSGSIHAGLPPGTIPEPASVALIAMMALLLTPGMARMSRARRTAPATTASGVGLESHFG